MSSSYSSLDWVLSHWAHFTVGRSIYLCLSLCIFCVFVSYCIVVVLWVQWDGPDGIEAYRDAKSPISGGRLPYLDIHYALPYGRTYLPFSPFTYGTSAGDHHNTCWWSHCLAARPPSAPLFTNFTYWRSSRANSQCARRCTIVNIANWSDKSEKIKKYMQKYKDECSY